MFTYKEYEEILDAGYPTIPPSYGEVEKKLEIELLKFTLDKIIREYLVDQEGLSAKTLSWKLKKVLAFDFDVEEITNTHYKIFVPDGTEKVCIEVEIKTSK
jgi:hypothetical protein